MTTKIELMLRASVFSARGNGSDVTAQEVKDAVSQRIDEAWGESGPSAMVAEFGVEFSYPEWVYKFAFCDGGGNSFGSLVIDLEPMVPDVQEAVRDLSRIHRCREIALAIDRSVVIQEQFDVGVPHKMELVVMHADDAPQLPVAYVEAAVGDDVFESQVVSLREVWGSDEAA